jgi:hypothetical protein
MPVRSSRSAAQSQVAPSKILRSPARRAVARLREVADRIKVMQSSVAVAVAALRAQNADIDADVARLLIRAVSDPLQEQLDSIKSVIRWLDAAQASRQRRKR